MLVTNTNGKQREKAHKGEGPGIARRCATLQVSCELWWHTSRGGLERRPAYKQLHFDRHAASAHPYACNAGCRATTSNRFCHPRASRYPVPMFSRRSRRSLRKAVATKKPGQRPRSRSRFTTSTRQCGVISGAAIARCAILRCLRRNLR